MSIVTGFNVTLSEVELLAEASIAAFAGGDIPAGWNVVTPASLGVSSAYWDGNYFTNAGASAIVLQQGNDYIVSFRGTDGTDDIVHYPELFFGGYIDNFQPLLSALANATPPGAQYYFTGASLGGGATNLMANIASTQYGGEYAAAKFVAFASPNISNANGILNIGAENDPVYKAINLYGDFSSSLDNFVLATEEYMAGNYDGRHPFNAYAHDQADLGMDAFGRMDESLFSDLMSPDSVIIIDASAGAVTDMMPGRQNTGAFYLGEAVGDEINGHEGGDYIEGFDGNDVLTGYGGNDSVSGGNGVDWLNGNDGADRMVGGNDGDVIIGGNGVDIVVGSSGNDSLYGDADNDTVRGGAGNDTVDGGAGDDVLAGGGGNDVFAFDPAFGWDTIKDFSVGHDKIDLSALHTSFASVVVADYGSSVLVTAPGQGFITVEHTQSLHASDFIF